MAISMVMKIPAIFVLGEIMCWIIAVGFTCLLSKTILGGLFIALYRVIVIKYQKVALNLQVQWKISKELQKLEGVALISFVGFHMIGASLTGTDPIMALCKVSCVLFIELSEVKK